MKILVLCHGSINRSPFAAYLLRVLRPDLDVRVRALKQAVGEHKPTPKAFDAAEQSELDHDQKIELLYALHYHRSYSCTREDVLDADLTIYMDNANKARLEALLRPGDTPRTACLADYDRDATKIPDPNFLSRNKPDEARKIREIFALIERCVRRLAEELPRAQA